MQLVSRCIIVLLLAQKLLSVTPLKKTIDFVTSVGHYCSSCEVVYISIACFAQYLHSTGQSGQYTVY